MVTDLKPVGAPAINGLGSVTKLSLPDQVFASVRDALMCGHFAPSQRIPLRSISEALGTSTMPVREAVNRLVAVGALEALPSGRVRVPPLSEPRFRDITTARIVIESSAARAATPLLTDKDVEALSRIHQQMRKVLRNLAAPGAHQEYLKLNKSFHFTLYCKVGSSILLATVESLWLQIGPYLNLSLLDSQGWFKTDQHLPILRAVRAHDAEAVQIAVATNIDYAARFVLSSKKLALLAGEALESGSAM